MRNIKAAVVAEQNVIVILRVDPDGVVIAVRNAAHCSPRLAAVDGLEERRAALIRNLRVRRVDADLAVVSSGRPGSTGTSRSCRCRRFARCRSLRIGRGRLVAASAAESTPSTAAPTGLRQRPSSFTPAPVPPLGPTSIDAQYTVDGFDRAISRPIRPIIGLSGRPFPVSLSRFRAVGCLPDAAAGAAAVEPQGCRRRW